MLGARYQLQYNAPNQGGFSTINTFDSFFPRSLTLEDSNSEKKKKRMRSKAKDIMVDLNSINN